MTKDKIRMKLWCDVWLSEWNNESETTICLDNADFALTQFDQRFPAESSDTKDHIIGNAREFWNAYQLGQVSADHTDFEVFEEVIQPLIDRARLAAAFRALLVENGIEPKG